MGYHSLQLDAPLCHCPPLQSAILPTHASRVALRPQPLQFPTYRASTYRSPQALLGRSQKAPKEQQVAKEEKESNNSTTPPAQEEYEEVEISWVQEKVEDLYQMTGNAVNALPGPRVGNTSMPWLLAVPIGYLGITFVIAVKRTVDKFNSPKAKRRRMVGKNAFLCKSLDDFFPARRFELDTKQLSDLEKKTSFDTEEVLRKYIRYALNERPFNPDTVADLIHLRSISQLEDSQIVEILNEVSRRIVKEKGPVVMDTRGMTQEGVKRKAAVQSLFRKLLYLSELDEFCLEASRKSLRLKEIFGVTDEDANSIRIETLSEVADVESLEKMVSPSDEDSEEEQAH